MKKGKFNITPDNGSNSGKITVVCEGGNSPYITRRQNIINIQGGGITKSCTLKRNGISLQAWYDFTCFLQRNNPYNVPNVLDDSKDMYSSYWHATLQDKTIKEVHNGGHDYYDFGLQEFDTSNAKYEWTYIIDNVDKDVQTNGKIVHRHTLNTNSYFSVMRQSAQSFRIYMCDVRVIGEDVSSKLDILPVSVMDMNRLYLINLGWEINHNMSHDGVHDIISITKTVDGACPILVVAKADRDKTDDAFVIILD